MDDPIVTHANEKLGRTGDGLSIIDEITFICQIEIIFQKEVILGMRLVRHKKALSVFKYLLGVKKISDDDAYYSPTKYVFLFKKNPLQKNKPMDLFDFKNILE